MKISFVIPNYNGASLLKRNLPSVYEAAEYYTKQSGNTYEIIVTDDASTDDSSNVISSFTFPVQLLKHANNAGFSTNVNRGVSKATGDIVILLNTDVRPEKQFLMPLLSHFENESVFGVGCMDLSIEKGKEKKRGRGEGKFSKGFLIHRAGEVTKHTTLWVSGGSSAFRRSMFDKLGGFYAIYNPFYWEDIDLSYRALKAGYLLVFEPESRVVHEHEAGSIKTQFTNKKIVSVAYRNQFFFVWLNITRPSYIFSHILWIPVHCFFALIRGDLQFFFGFIKALYKLPEALRLRRKNIRMFRVDDETALNSTTT